MEIFLLFLDDLDDLLHALRVSLPKIAGFGVALIVFASIVVSAMIWPWTVMSVSLLAALAMVILSSPRTVQFLRVKTDP